MAAKKYEAIYRDLKKKIEGGEFPTQEFLPSENTLIESYNCSRNTVRRAISKLVSDGYVQSMQGMGVRNIYTPMDKTIYTLGEIESFRESAERNGQVAKTEVLSFQRINADKRISALTTFPQGTELYYIQRLHLLDDTPLIINHNYFLAEKIMGLSPQIAEASIYDYIENTLKVNIINSKRIVSVEKLDEIDEKYLKSDDELNCVVLVSSFTYDDQGVMFEFTQSRHRPDFFRFQDNAVRKHN